MKGNTVMIHATIWVKYKNIMLKSKKSDIVSVRACDSANMKDRKDYWLHEAGDRNRE